MIVYLNISRSVIWITLGNTEQYNCQVTKLDTQDFGMLPILFAVIGFVVSVFGHRNMLQILCFWRPQISHCLFSVIFITFYPFEHSLGPIMEIMLLSYACNLPISSRLHGIPSRKHWSWIIKEDYFVLMHLIIMLSWWNKLFMETVFCFIQSIYNSNVVIYSFFKLPILGSWRVSHDQGESALLWL